MGDPHVTQEAFLKNHVYPEILGIHLRPRTICGIALQSPMIPVLLQV